MPEYCSFELSLLFRKNPFSLVVVFFNSNSTNKLVYQLFVPKKSISTNKKVSVIYKFSIAVFIYTECIYYTNIYNSDIVQSSSINIYLLAYNFLNKTLSVAAVSKGGAHDAL